MCNCEDSTQETLNRVRGLVPVWNIHDLTKHPWMATCEQESTNGVKTGVKRKISYSNTMINYHLLKKA